MSIDWKNETSTVMRAIKSALLLCLLAAPAFAQSVQFKGGAASIGDSVKKLHKVAGKPDQVRPFPGAPATSLHEYSLGERQVNVSVRGGKITGIADNHIVSKPGPAVLTGVDVNGTRIVTGDPLAKLVASAGKPHKIRTFADAPHMSVYEYTFPGREVTVTVTNGKVSGTSELKIRKR
ncbi:hypothetical protein [Cognatilysobacter bugurensis]|uniref:Uncharacterized protein n=1 Tax=Cognatilysobacter bugurensis TaxID=543356 RepID=A0A918T1V5_9GAMM|nr:hypothetical protein [Lysobacter bugurensis]GHA86302.1 hypothetical protein GCM10007067_25440 [Lysobacter bugurensis]